MTDKEYFVSTITSEIPKFENVIKALPQDKLDYKPDPKARTAMELATVIANESGMFSAILKTGGLDFSSWPRSASTTTDALVVEMKTALADAAANAKSMTDEDWASEGKMLMGGKEVWKATKGQLVLGFLLDLIHHRGQLSVYIRPMGGKVPSIYGPSADTNE